MSEQSTDLRETVRRRYAAAALQVIEGASACCGPRAAEVDENFGAPCMRPTSATRCPPRPSLPPSAAAIPSPSPT